MDTKKSVHLFAVLSLVAVMLAGFAIIGGTSHSFAYGQTLIVDGTGDGTDGKYATLGAAVEAAEDGDVINVTGKAADTKQPGVNKSVTIHSDGAKAVKPEKDPAVTGYTFAGWFKAVDGVAEDTAFEFDTPINGNTHLAAKYDENAYKITFDPNDGSGTMQDMELRYTESKELNANEFTKDNATFKGGPPNRQKRKKAPIR